MVKNGEIILFESDNSEIKVEPDSETVKYRHGKKYQQLSPLDHNYGDVFLNVLSCRL